MSVGKDPAFAFPPGKRHAGWPGMTYREWLIGQALANSDIAHTEKAHGSVAEWAETVAGMVIACADAVIRRLDAETKGGAA